MTEVAEKPQKKKEFKKVCPICNKQFTAKHFATKYCDECRALKDGVNPNEPKPMSLTDRVGVVDPEMAFAFRIKNKEQISALPVEERDSIINALMDKEAEHDFGWVRKEFKGADQAEWVCNAVNGTTYLVIHQGEKVMGLVMFDGGIQNMNRDETKMDKIRDAKEYLGLR